MDRKLMVKRKLGEIPEANGRPRLEVFESGEPGWYIFAPMQSPGVSGTIHIPVRGKDLVRGWKRQLV